MDPRAGPERDAGAARHSSWKILNPVRFQTGAPTEHKEFADWSVDQTGALSELGWLRGGGTKQ